MFFQGENGVSDIKLVFEALLLFKGVIKYDVMIINPIAMSSVKIL